MKKLLLLGVVACAIALSVFARQSSAKESDDAEIRAMEAAMAKAFAAKDLDHGLALGDGVPLHVDLRVGGLMALALVIGWLTDTPPLVRFTWSATGAVGRQRAERSDLDIRSASRLLATQGQQ